MALILKDVNAASSRVFRMSVYTSAAGFPASGSGNSAAIAFDDTAKTLHYSNGTSWLQLAALANDLAAVEGLSTTGIAVRTATDTWATRTFAVSSGSSSSASLSIANADGTGGNPTIAINTNNASFKLAVECATTANITLSGLQTIDGISVTAGNRVLVKDQTTASGNGIYTASSGAWSRDSDFDSTLKSEYGLVVYVKKGTAQAGQYWKMDTAYPLTLGTTALSFSQVFTAAGLSGTGSASKLAYWTGSGTLSFNTNFHLDNTNSRLGINTTSPILPLHVDGQAAFGDSSTTSNAIRSLNLCGTAAVMRILRVSANSDTAAPAIELLHRTSADGANTLYYDIYTDTGGMKFRDRTSGDQIRMTINTSGAFGFGITPNTTYKGYFGGAVRAEGVFQSYGSGNTYSGFTAAAIRITNSTPSTGDSWYIGSRDDGSLDIQSGNLTQVARWNTTTGRFDMSYSWGLTGFANSASLAANQNNYDIGDGGSGSVFRLTSTTTINITGLAGGVSGRVVCLINIGSSTITLTNEDANSTAANRFALGSSVALAASQSVMLWYDTTSSRWRPFGGSGGGGASGAPTTVPYLTIGNDANLSAERAITMGTNMVAADGGANSTYTISALSQTLTLPSVISPTSFSTAQNNYAPSGFSTTQVLRLTATAASTITGLAGGSAGLVAIMHNIGSFVITLANESASSTAANRFSMGNDTFLGPNKSVILWYDTTSSRWKIIGAYEDKLAVEAQFSTQTVSYTLVLADAGKQVTINNASANTLTVPPNSSVAFAIGTVINVTQLGAGKTTITPGAGVTINSPDGDLKLRTQYSTASLLKTGTDTWLLMGDISAT